MKTKSTDAPNTKLRFGIKLKLFLIVLISFGALMAFIVGFIRQQAETLADEAIAVSLTRSEEVLRTRIASRFRSISQAAKSIAIDSRIRPLVYFKDSAGLHDQSDELQQALGFDIVIFTDQEGTILARSDKPEATGKSVIKSSLFREALSGKTANGFMRIKNDLLQIVAYPVVDNTAPDIVRGSLGIAYKLTGVLAHEIKSLTACEIVFQTAKSQGKGKDTVLSSQQMFSTYKTGNGGSTPTLVADQGLLSRITESSSPLKSDLHHNKEHFLALFFPLRAHDGRLVGLITAFRSRTALLAPYEKIATQTMVIGVACLGIGVLLAYLISRGITNPIIELVSVAREIEQGRYPEPKSINSKDEVGILYRAVFSMGQELKKKADLEDYLAGFSDSLLEIGGDDTLPMLSEFPTLKASSWEKSPLKEGQNFDQRYIITAILGRGGMGTVYQAQDSVLDEQVALKVLRSSAFNPTLIELFKQEMKLARKITHRNIVRTFDFGSSDGLNYITMEYVPGYTLRSFIRKNRKVDVSMGIIMMRQICAALTAAHSEGIIHRDLKAENVIINRRGIIKIMDFGIAVAIGATLPEQKLKKTKVTTDKSGKRKRVVQIAGTPAYMAPEQFKGDAPDTRSDIYSLGVLMFYLFSGKFPFSGPGVDKLMYEHCKVEAPAIRSINAEVPQSLEEIVAKSLAKNRSERFQSTAQLASALAQVK